MLKVLSGLLGLVVVAGVVWVIDPFGDDGLVWDAKPDVSVEPSAVPSAALPDDSEVVISWETADAHELLDPAGHTIEFTTTRDDFRAELGCDFEIPGDLHVYLSADGWDQESAQWCTEPRANHFASGGGSVILGGPGKHSITLRALHKDGSPYVPADGTIEINLAVIDHVEGWVGG
ncbi:hypothetical protein [Nocardioides luteus]|uniref:hypothetical protein n=1 Tax=Nocardioides luteus TaxID=1844 RepID=UPI0018CAD3A1|nr:hypothetical protein [Nocardioides luteus]MBG6099023.1 hypothetical protein [Nocardioides luteus]